jgi:hypothetical protein
VAVFVALLGALSAYLALVWLNPAPIDPRQLPTALIAAVHAAPDTDLAAAETNILSAIPRGQRAVLDPADDDPQLKPGPHGADGQLMVTDLPRRPSALTTMAEYGPVVAEGTRTTTWVAVTVPPVASHPSALGLLVALITAMTGGAAALAMALFRLPRTEPDAPSTSPAAVPVQSTDPRVTALAGQRDRLVRGLADLVGKLPPELEWQATGVLDSAGVHQVVVADGATFNPTMHHAVGTERTADAARNDTVARTLRPGWADAERMLIPPRVVVYVAMDRPGVAP